MKRAADFIVEKRYFIVAVFLIIAAVCGLLSTKVVVNYDMSKYLPDDSPAKAGAAIMEDQFPASNMLNVMFRNLDMSERDDIKNALLEIGRVSSVTYDGTSEKYSKDGHALYALTMDAGAFSPEAQATVSAIKQRFASYDMLLSGEASGLAAIDNMLFLLFVPAVLIMIVILTSMCHSWFEPVIFMLNIGLAVIMNMGTNAVFDSVSDITQSIAAVLQLALSMDYSIMLLDRYRKEREKTSDKNAAMKNALRNAFTAISGSSITTVVGMMMLVFMSFTIGMDMGLVLAKGVFLSLVCIFTVMPAMILLSEKLIARTAKPVLRFKMDGIGSVFFRARHFIFAAFIVLFGAAFMLRGSVIINYSVKVYDDVYQVFTPDNPIVVVYRNKDEERVAGLAEEWKKLGNTVSVNAYSTTIGAQRAYDDMAEAMGMDSAIAALVYANYFGGENGAGDIAVPLGELVQFIKNELASDEVFAGFIDDDILSVLDIIDGGPVRLSAAEMAEFAGVAEPFVQIMFNLYFNVNGATEDGRADAAELVRFITKYMEENEQFARLIPEDMRNVMDALGGVSGDLSALELTAGQLASFVQMDESAVAQLFYYYDIVNGKPELGTMTIAAFMDYILETLAENELFKAYLSEDMLAELRDGRAAIEDNKGSLIGSVYSRAIIITDLPPESEETFAFVAAITQDMEDTATDDYYVVGDSVIGYEMSRTFPPELDFITILTAISIFLVVALVFRSLSIPLILISLIQCAVFITMGSLYFQGEGIMYLPLLIVQCILMGATIDYGILYASNYREARAVQGVKDSAVVALNNSMHTIMTSGLILIVVTLVLGLVFTNINHAISEILLLIARGCLVSVVLVIFVLPSLITVFDRFTKGGKKP